MQDILFEDIGGQLDYIINQSSVSIPLTIVTAATDNIPEKAWIQMNIIRSAVLDRKNKQKEIKEIVFTASGLGETMAFRWLAAGEESQIEWPSHSKPLTITALSIGNI